MLGFEALTDLLLFFFPTSPRRTETNIRRNINVLMIKHIKELINMKTIRIKKDYNLVAWYNLIIGCVLMVVAKPDTLFMWLSIIMVSVSIVWFIVTPRMKVFEFVDE